MTEEIFYHQSVREAVLNLFSLCKVKIALFATLSAVAGLLSVSFPAGTVAAKLAAGVFLLAAGAGALNHYQERHTDALMNRTADRPLPAGKINPVAALLFSIALICWGCAVLLMNCVPAAIIGLTTVLWYNGFYTWWKAHNGLAAIPGALVGALPPAIGWVMGGGEIFDLRLAVLCFFFLVWQVFHFLIHMIAYGREYEEAGLPSLSAIFTSCQLRRLAFQWLLAAVVSAQLIVLFGVIHSILAQVAVIAASGWLVFQGIVFVRQSDGVYTDLFRKTNYYMLQVLLLTIFDGLFRIPAVHYFGELIK